MKLRDVILAPQKSLLGGVVLGTCSTEHSEFYFSDHFKNLQLQTRFFFLLVESIQQTDQVLSNVNCPSVTQIMMLVCPFTRQQRCCIVVGKNDV